MRKIVSCLALLMAAGLAVSGFADEAPAAAAAAAVPVPNKGDVSWMLVSTLLVLMMSVPRAGTVLRRHGARQEHAVGTDAGFRGLLADHRALVHLRLQSGLHRGQCLLRQLWPALSQWSVRFVNRHLRDGGHLQQGDRHPRDAVCRLPGHLRRHHLLSGGGAPLPSGPASRPCCCSWCSGSPSPTFQLRTWSGSGWGPMPTAIRRWSMP
jgi:hypothetical protein